MNESIVKFDQFASAEEAFKQRYGEWLLKNPYAALLVESKLREEFDLSQGRRIHERRKKPLKQYMPTYRNWRQPIYRFLLEKKLAFADSFVEGSPSVDWQWHQEKRNSITADTGNYGLLINRGDAKGLAALNAWSMRLQSVVGVSPEIWKIYSNIYYALEQSRNLEASRLDFDYVERRVQAEVQRASRLYKKSNVKFMVMGSDQSAYNRLKCEAARQAGIKTAVIGHGYFGSRHLGGVIPVYADRLFVWTELQRQQIHEVIALQDRLKVVYQGFPYPVNQASDSRSDSSVLIALDDISKYDPEGWWDTLDKIIWGLIEQAQYVIVRPRRADEIDVFKSRYKSPKVHVSRANLYDDFDKVARVICGASSVGVQSAYYGLPTARVAEWTTERSLGEGIPRVPAESFFSVQSQASWSKPFCHADAKKLTVDKIVNVLSK